MGPEEQRKLSSLSDETFPGVLGDENPVGVT